MGAQHTGVLENFAVNILDGTPLIAPRSNGINGVRLANAIHLSSWTGKAVSLDFDEDEYLAELNKRIREEGKFPVRGLVALDHDRKIPNWNLPATPGSVPGQQGTACIVCGPW